MARRAEAGDAVDNLLVMIDCTGSMGSWIAALNEVLPQVLQVVTLTGAFERISILQYGDYDSEWGGTPVQFSGWITPGKPELMRFAAQLRPRGGGGAPEAVKTALYCVLKNLPPTGHVHLLHLTDAPAHSLTGLDTEGKQELSALGNEAFDWITVASHVAAAPITYTCVSSDGNNPFDAYLARRTNGELHDLHYVSQDGIRSALISVFNGWMGCPDGELPAQTYDLRQVEGVIVTRAQAELAAAPNIPLGLLSRAVAFVTSGVTGAARAATHTSQEGHLSGRHIVEHTVEARPSLVARFNTIVPRMQRDEAYVDLAVQCLRSIIATRPTLLCANAVFGRLWRSFCTRRADPRRDEMLRDLDVAKSRLDAANQTKLEAWIRESYDASGEVQAELREFIAKHGVRGVVRYTGDDAFHPQDLMEVFMTMSRRGQAQIIQVLARCSIDPSVVIPADPSLAEDEEKPLPLPADCIPLNLRPDRLFSLLLTVVSPGLRLARRASAITALLALRAECVLAPTAREYLASLRGKWISFTRKEDGTPEIPENYNAAFAAVVLQVPEVTTAEEANMLQLVLRAARVMRVDGVEVTVQVEERGSADGCFPEHVRECPECHRARPISLITESGSCAYCIYGHGEMVPAASAESQLQVRCASCGSIYARSPRALVPGRPRCHYCRSGAPRAPTSTCTSCRIQFVTPLVPLPGGRCAPCTQGMRARELSVQDIPVPLRKLFPLRSFSTQLCAAAGIALDGPAPLTEGMPMYQLVDRMRLAECAAVPRPAAPTYNNHPIVNLQTVWDTAMAALRGDRQEPAACSLCFDASHDLPLLPVCGRRGCTQRICEPCGRAWYGMIRPGELLNVRHLACPFCARTPTHKTLRRWNPAAVALCNGPVMDPALWYAWCLVCNRPCECGDRACGVEAPRIAAFTCEPCVERRAAMVAEAARLAAARAGGVVPAVEADDASAPIMECPGCHVPTLLVSGCNHITCQCGQHWCYDCGAGFASSEETYAHMQGAHGRLFRGEVPMFGDEDGE